MPTKPTAQYPHRWPDGSYHSIPYARHVQNVGYTNPVTPNLAQIAKSPLPLARQIQNAGYNTPGSANLAQIAAGAKPGSFPAGAPDVPGAATGDTASPGEVPLPPDPEYERQRGQRATQRDKTLAGLTQQRTSGLTNYGFTEAPDTGALAFDPNNPFSRASLLKKNYDISRARTGGQMASGGQLYAGAYQTAQDTLNRGQLGDEDTLQKSLGDFLMRNTGARTEAQTGYETDISEINRAERALDSPLYSPTADTPIAAPPKVVAPKQTVTAPVKKAAVTSKKPSSIKAGPAVKPTKRTTVTKKKKGRTVTYSTSVKRP